MICLTNHVLGKCLLNKLTRNVGYHEEAFNLLDMKYFNINWSHSRKMIKNVQKAKGEKNLIYEC